MSLSYRCIARIAALAILVTPACDDDDDDPRVSDGPFRGSLPAEFDHPTGSAAAGQEVFRFETFGNQGFWTTAMQLPQGLAGSGLTPIQALGLGLSVDADALNPDTRAAVLDALTLIENGADPTTTALGDPAVTLSLINQNAVLGVVTFDADGNRKDPGNESALDLAGGDSVGISCALCHSITDGSTLPPDDSLGTRGGIGTRVDGPTPHGLDVGTILAAADRSLAYFPMLQIDFDELNGATIGRSPSGLAVDQTALPSETQVDEYLTGSGPVGRHYPVGQFDALPDGIGNPTHIQPLFRTDLAAPWGVDGAVAQLQDFNNTVYTVSLDPTSILLPAGRQFLDAVAGPIGAEIAADYEVIVRTLGLLDSTQSPEDVFPYIEAFGGFAPGTPDALVGLRVDETKLVDLNAYLDSLPAPTAPDTDPDLVARGRELFRTLGFEGGNCTTCHDVDAFRFVPPTVTPIEDLYPDYSPDLILERTEPLSDIQNSGGGLNPLFDDRVVVLDATFAPRGSVRGSGIPMLLGVFRQTALLHDDSVSGATFEAAADRLLDPNRGPSAAHPFYLRSADKRAAVVEFLKSLGN